MSSMVRKQLLAIASLGVIAATAGSAPLVAEEAREWDNARAALVASQPGEMARAVERWQQLTNSPDFSFADYAGFVLAYPGLPDEEKLRGYAEARVREDQVDPTDLIAFFDRFEPVTNPARAQYALALASRQRPEAFDWALKAWRGGEMTEIAEVTLEALYGARFAEADHNARMDALLWDGDLDHAARQAIRTSEDMRPLFLYRLALQQGEDPDFLGLVAPDHAAEDPGYVYDYVRQRRNAGRNGDALNLLTTRPALASLPHNQTRWVTEFLRIARLGNARQAQRIAASIDDGFAPGADISALEYKLRDDYTSLMWLGGTKSLWELGDPASAAPLFYRYGAAARTPQTRSKGFYWAGLAYSQAGMADAAAKHFALAAEYPDRFYGMLAMQRLGVDMPNLAGAPDVTPEPAHRASFQAEPLTAAVREVAREAPWSVGIRFYREIAAQAESEADMVLVLELAKDLGRRDLAVIAGEAAAAKGFENFESEAFPTLAPPAGTNWTMVHSISRQESQFAQNAISHAGARGLMQLMPGTAQEQAGRLGINYMRASLIDDADYNIRLGDSYFRRMLDYYGGSYPLAVGAYNAGPGNVNKWLRANGDPRKGDIGWVEWIERVPIYETKNYIQRVLENAVVYEAMHPDLAQHGHAHTIDEYLTEYLGR